MGEPFCFVVGVYTPAGEPVVRKVMTFEASPPRYGGAADALEWSMVWTTFFADFITALSLINSLTAPARWAGEARNRISDHDDGEE